MMLRCLKITVLALSLLVFAPGVKAQDTRAQEERKARLEREIAIIDRQLAENASQSSSMLSDLTLIRKKISNRKALVTEADRHLLITRYGFFFASSIRTISPPNISNDF